MRHFKEPPYKSTLATRGASKFDHDIVLALDLLLVEVKELGEGPLRRFALCAREHGMISDRLLPKANDLRPACSVSSIASRGNHQNAMCISTT